MGHISNLKIFMTLSSKLRHSEKATILEKISHMFWRYWLMSLVVHWFGRVEFRIFVVVSWHRHTWKNKNKYIHIRYSKFDKYIDKSMSYQGHKCQYIWEVFSNFVAFLESFKFISRITVFHLQCPLLLRFPGLLRTW